MELFELQDNSNESIVEFICNTSKFACYNLNEHCKTIDGFIKLNLINVYGYMYLGLYSNINYLTDEDVNMIFNINHNKNIITLQVCNNLINKSQKYREYNDDFVDETAYFKKYISCFIRKDKLKLLRRHIYLYNYFKGTNIKIITSDELNELEEYYTINNEFERKEENTLTFRENKDCLINFQSITYIFKGFNNFNKELLDTLSNEYQGLLIYEDAINTETNLIEIIDYINNLL